MISKDALVNAGSDAVRVSFALPYRCTFGQHLALVGSINPLGSWDVRQGVTMSWTEGDICATHSALPSPAGCALLPKQADNVQLTCLVQVPSNQCCQLTRLPGPCRDRGP